MPWFRVWTDILDSEKFADLDDATIGGWTLILSAVKRFDQDGILPPLRKLAHWIRRPSPTVSAWIKELVRVGLLEEEGERVHDWIHWQGSKDRTNAERQARYKARHRNSPSGLPHSKQEEIQTRHRQAKTVTEVTLPKRDNAEITALPCTDVSESESVLEPFDPGPETESPVEDLSPDKQRVLDRQSKRWGHSNGERTIKDMLDDYSAEIVENACNYIYDQKDNRLTATRLRGICKKMFNGEWTSKANDNGHVPETPKPKTYGIIQGP